MQKSLPFLVTVGLVIAILYLFYKPQPSTPSLTQTQSQPTATECNLTPTPSQTEGPYYQSGSPQQTNIAQDLAGEKLIIKGVVLDKNCKPKAGAWLDFWQAGANGQYDNAGYKLRGHQYTDKDGKYTLETVVPAQYSTRPPHIHVKVKTADGPSLTTQLYFPNAPLGKELILDVKQIDGINQATFNFVL